MLNARLAQLTGAKARAVAGSLSQRWKRCAIQNQYGTKVSFSREA